MNYAFLALQHPDMFVQEDPAGGARRTVAGSTSPLTDLIAGPYDPPFPDSAAAAPGSLGMLHAMAALMRGLGPNARRTREALGRAELNTLAAAVAEAAAARGQPLGMPPGSAVPPPPVALQGSDTSTESPGAGLPQGFLDQLLKRVAEEEDEAGAGEESSLSIIMRPVFTVRCFDVFLGRLGIVCWNTWLSG